MLKSYYRVSDSAVYRRIENELVVIQLANGTFYHFNEETEPLLSFFKAPRQVSDFVDASGISRRPDEDGEVKHIEGFCEFLVQNGILEAAEQSKEAASRPKVEYSRPRFLRKGDQTLDELTFLCPVS